jgi:hypothetical protein
MCAISIVRPLWWLRGAAASRAADSDKQDPSVISPRNAPQGGSPEAELVRHRDNGLNLLEFTFYLINKIG